MQKRIAVTALALLGLAGPAAAAPIDLVEGPYEAKYSNVEGFFLPGTLVPCATITVGCENVGIFVVTSIFSWPINLNPNAWFETSTPGEITGHFYDLFVHEVTPTADGFDVNSTGGRLDLYWDDAENYNGTLANATNGTLMVSFFFIPGIIPGDPLTTVNGSVDALTDPLTGQAAGYLAVIPGSGAWAAFFDGNAIPGHPGAPAGADAFSISNFRSCGVGECSAPWSLVSNDPVIGTIVPFQAPEPASMALFGLALVGLARARRRN